MKKQIFTLLTLLGFAVGVSAQTTYGFDTSGMTESDLTITNGSYNNHKISASAESVMTVQVKTYPITFTYDNSGGNKAKEVFTNFASDKAYLQANVKNTTITISGLTVGDIIAVDYSGKNDSEENIAGTLTGCQADVNNQTSSSKARVVNKFIATATTASIKETNNGYLLYSITIYHSVELTLSKDMVSFSDLTNKLSFENAATATTGADALKAYAASAADGSSVTLTEEVKAPASTGLILTGSKDAVYKIAILDNAVSAPTNKLVATDGTSTVSSAAVLSAGEFHPFSGGVIAAGKAYLPYANITGGDPFAGGAHSLEINFDNGTTAIKAVEAKKAENGVFYNLAGQQVAQPQKGLYIVNGKKVVIK